MTTTVILVRHAAHDWLGCRLAGRGVDMELSSLGAAQAERLAAELGSRDVAAVTSSPRLRTRQTARPIARACRLPLLTAPEFDELNFGEWTGRSFDELQNDPCWWRWNLQRAQSRPPAGESMAELQERVVNGLTEIVTKHRGRCVVIVSHAEPIRVAVLHHCRMPLDDFARVPIDPASLTTLQFDGERGRVAIINETFEPTMVPA